MTRRTIVGLGVSACMLAAIGCGAEGRVPLGKSEPPAVLGASLTDYEGAWDGYVEAHKWDDQTDFVRLRLNGDGRGVLQIGAPNTPPPDIFEGADPGIPHDKPWLWSLQPGFDYEVEGALLTSRRIQLGTSSTLLYAEWCNGFEPVADAQGEESFSCLPNVGWSHEEGDPEGCRLMDADRTPVSCLDLSCWHVCQCNESECSVGVVSDVVIDAALMAEGDELAGTLLIGGERYNVRMQRSE